MSTVFSDDYPKNYLDQQNVQSKQLNMVVEIEGYPFRIGIVPTYKKVRYGDPGILYGEPGLNYGALAIDPNVIVGLSLNSGLTISQQLEPEQGRASVATMTLAFVDFNAIFSQLISPGQDLDDILGNKLIKVRVGYQNTGYPEDYLVVFRGYASSTRSQSGLITIQLSDANLKRRAPIYNIQQTTLTNDIDSTQTTITVGSTDGFSKRIMGPEGTYDPNAKTYIQIEDEIMEYDQFGIIDGTTFTVTRGSLGTIATAHTADAPDTTSSQGSISQRYIIEGNIIDIALKTMISGWNGPWQSDVKIAAIQNGLDLGSQPNILRFPDGINTSEEYNATPGDYLYVTGSTAGNDGTYIVLGLGSTQGEVNNVIFTTTNFPAPEYPADSVRIAFRSKYDTFPVECGTKMKPSEIDMKTWIDTRDTFYASTYSQMRFFPTASTDGKTQIEKEILLPSSLYSVTRFGRLSVKLTLPPIAGQKIVTLDNTNVIDPQNIIVERALNTRRFFNDIEYSYDQDYLTGDFNSVAVLFDSDSLNVIGLDSQMPIQSQGIRTDLQADQLINKRGLNLLNRYKKAAYELQGVKTNWGTGSLIEAGDTVIVADDGKLQITNLDTGKRNLGKQLFEVISRQIEIKTGQVSLKLLSNVGYQVTDRFAVIAPTSQVASVGSSVSSVLIQDSYGFEYPDNEPQKWSALSGEQITVHTKDYSQSFTTTLIGFDSANRYLMLVSPDLPWVPDDNFVVEVADYPTDTNPGVQAVEKLLYCYIDPSVSIVSAADATHFVVSPSDAAKFTVGLPVSVHNADFSIDSSSKEINVKSILSNTIELASALPFTPSPGETAELIGFPDGGGPFRVL